jgi:hypothetical protein
MENRPDNVNVIAIIMIVSGAINILWGIAGTIMLLLTLIGVFCIPLGLIPIGIGIYEILQGINILNNRPVKNVTLVGGLEIASVLWANILSLLAGILVLVIYNDEQVKAYLDGITIDIVPAGE